MDENMRQRWSELCRRAQGQGYASLSPEEKVWINLRGLIDSIENGGLISYFYNSFANTLADCRQALHQVEAEDVRRLVDRVCALVPGGVPEDWDARHEIVDAWPDDSSVDALLSDVDDRLMPAMPGLEQRLANFLRNRGLVE